jgi:Fungal rhodopsin domain
MRIFPVKKFIWSCYITLGIVITWSTASVISTVFQCNPVAGFWDSKIPGMKCYNTDAFWYAYAIINIITDVAVLLLPLPEVRKLHLPVMERVGVGAIFAIGIL